MGRARTWNGVARYLMQPVDGETLEAVSGGKSPIVCPPDPQKSHRDRVLSQFYGYNGN